MIYTLFIWTVVAMAGDRFHQAREYDWRPIAEFQAYPGQFSPQELCEQSAKQLGLKSDRYRCVRTK